MEERKQTKFIEPTGYRFKGREVIRRVGFALGINENDIIGNHKFKDFVIARVVCIIYYRDYVNYSFNTIAYFMNKNRENVVYLYKKYKDNENIRSLIKKTFLINE